jgi:tetratricopeptide (TPR) repeat protein
MFEKNLDRRDARRVMKTLALIAVAAVIVVLVAGFMRRGRSSESYLARGNVYAAEQRYPEAIIEYRNAVKKDPRSGQTRAKLADAYLQTGDARNAIRETVLAADLMPNDTEAQLKAGQLLLLAERFEDAKTRAEKALSVDPNNFGAQLLRGSALIGMKDDDGALQQIDDAIKLDPGDARGYAVLGSIRLSKGQRAEAEAAFKRAVEAQPSSAVALMSLADFYWSAGRITEVEPLLQQVIALEPGNVTAHRALVRFYLGTGRAADAEAPLKTVADLVKDVPSRLALADYYLATRRLDEARVLLNAIRDSKEGFAGASLRLAALDYEQHHVEAAHQQVDAVIAKEPKNVDALLEKARFLQAEKKTDEAFARATAAAAADPRSAAAQELLGTIQARRGEVDKAIASFNEALKLSPRAHGVRVQLAELNLAKGRPDTAVQLLDEVLHDAPRSQTARAVLVRALASTGDLHRAIAELNTLLEANPDSALLHAQMGGLRLRSKDRVAARREFGRATQLDPASFEAFAGLVALDLEEKNPARVKSAIEARMQKTPQDPSLLALGAATYAALHDTAHQEEMLRRLIEVAPNNLQAFAGLATLYAQEHKLDEARAGFEALAARMPKLVGPPTMVGVILQTQGKDAEAQKAYEQVLKLDPNAGLAANNLAWMYAEGGGNLDVALQLAQTAKRQLPDLPQVNDTLGWVYYKKDLAELAIPVFESNVRTSPKDPTYRYHLGLAYAKSGQVSKAREAFDEVLRLKPDFHDAIAARQALSSKG